MNTNSNPNPPNPGPTPEYHQNSPYQQLGCLRILRGSPHLLCLTSHGVELVLPSGLSLRVPPTEIARLGFPSKDQFADCLELGASFPTASFSMTVMKDPRPLTLSNANLLPRPKSDAPPADSDNEPYTGLTPTQTEFPDGKPLPPAPPPNYFPHSGGGGGRTH
jgi:hypothetical protein